MLEEGEQDSISQGPQISVSAAQRAEAESDLRAGDEVGAMSESGEAYSEGAPEVGTEPVPQYEEPPPMLDVHPPHEPVHTWKAYLLHMSTIVLGLLIAIGLEQGVEVLHHRHQRHQLEEDVRAEARRNIDILTTHLDVNIPNMLWYRAALVQLRTAVARDEFVDVTLPPPNPQRSRSMVAPERYVEPGAIASGAIALLPEPIAQTFARYDFQAQEDEKEVDKIREDAAVVERFALASGDRIAPGEHLHLTLAQRDQLIAVFSTYAEGLYSLLRRDNLFLISSMAIADGVEDPNTLQSYVRQHPLVISKYAPGL